MREPEWAPRTTPCSHTKRVPDWKRHEQVGSICVQCGEKFPMTKANVQAKKIGEALGLSENLLVVPPSAPARELESLESIAYRTFPEARERAARCLKALQTAVLEMAGELIAVQGERDEARRQLADNLLKRNHSGASAPRCGRTLSTARNR